MPTHSYRAIMAEQFAEEPCRCTSCGWQGLYLETAPIVECKLSPGEPSPVGRCPNCEGLIYRSRDIEQ